jgi:signal transduction histidine kinase/CheY-like chemotaxis protein
MAVVAANIVFTKAIQQERSESLSAIADATRDRIEDYIQTRISDVNTVSMLAMWQNVLLSEQRNAQPLPHVQKILEAYISEKEYYDLLLIDIDGTIRYTVLEEEDLGHNIFEFPLNETQLALTVEASNTLLQTEISNFAFYPPTGDYAAFFASPIFAEGIIIGTVVLQIDQRALNQIINRYQGLGETGEILTAGQTSEGLIITSASRHDPEMFGRAISSDVFWPFDQALQGSQGGGRLIDHRGRQVLAEWRYLPSLNWGLITKIDLDEIYGPIYKLTRTLFWILLLSIVLVLAGTYLSYQQISGPLTRFAASVRSIRNKELPESIPVGGRFEIAELGHSFNELIADVRSYQKNLEVMVDERTHELKAALDKAEQANRAKSAFLATMSHEIRTPLNGVIGFTELLKSSHLDEMQQEYVRHAQTSGNTLLGIINDVLDFSKIEAGGLELEIQRRDILAVTREITDIVKYQAESKGVELLIDVPVNLPSLADVDDVRLRQICVNLLSNAIKFTYRGEIELKIRFERTGPDRGRYTFAVRDTGIGIKPEHKDKLFEAFSQADSSTSRKFGGTGLGLTISRLLVEKMGGRMWVESEYGKGSVFSFEIETSCEMAETLGAGFSDRLCHAIAICPEGTGTTILKQIFSDFGIRLSLFTSHNAAMDSLKANEPDYTDVGLLILDYGLTGSLVISEFRELARALRKDADALPLLVLYNSTQTSDVLQTTGGFARMTILQKPVTPRRITRVLDTLLHNQPDNNTKFILSKSILKPGETVTILVAEDVSLNMMLVKAMLNGLLPGVRVFEAADGLQATVMAMKHNPDLILMDINMPLMDGFDATRKIREQEIGANRRVPIIALTAGVMVEDRNMAADSGMDDFLTKPIDYEKLVAVLKIWLKEKVLP